MQLNIWKGHSNFNYICIHSIGLKHCMYLIDILCLIDKRHSSEFDDCGIQKC